MKPGFVKIDLTGRVIGKLTIVERIAKPHTPTHYRCRCECGNTKTIRSDSLTGGNTISCGCVQHQRLDEGRTIHGHAKHGSRTKTWTAWNEMHCRCRDNPLYSDRGIRVCDRWRSYVAFLKDMGEAPVGYSIERRENDGHYCPENCLWIPRGQQSFNTRRTRWVTLDGVQMPAGHAADKLGVNRGGFLGRIRKLGYTPGMDARKFSVPLKSGRKFTG